MSCTCLYNSAEDCQCEQLVVCRSEQYRQAVGLIQVQREEIVAKDKEIARLQKTSLVKVLRHARVRRLKCSPGCACDMCRQVIEILEGSGE
jgi:hypothetical protein